jgi:uncharacterized protein YndB with AHSA1/START domain
MKADTIEAIRQEIVIEATAQRVFSALTNPDELVRWWGAAGKFQAERVESDLRLGGAWKMTGVGMGGKPFTITGIFEEFDPPHVVAMTWLQDWQADAHPTLVKFELTEKDGVTTVRLTHSGFEAESDRENHKGWPWLLSLLRDYVTG